MVGMSVYVLGIEPFKVAQVFGIHSNKRKALDQAESLESNKSKLCCQRYVALTKSEINKMKLELYI